MKNTIYILLSFVLINCSKPKNKTSIESRTVHAFYTDKAKPIMNCELIIKEGDSITTYNYRHSINEEKNLEFSFNKNSNRILMFGSERILSGNPVYINKNLQDYEFNTYRSRELRPDEGYLLFNPEYGFLSIQNVLAPSFVCLPTENNSLAKEILYDSRK